MSQVDQAIAYAQGQVGKPYLLGSTGPNDFDCSGLVYSSYKEGCDLELPRSSTDQYTAGTSIDRSALQPGDLVFFDTGWTDRVPNHNGIYLGDGKFINANSYNNAVVEDSLDSGYWTDKFYGARRVISGGSSSSTVATLGTDTGNPTTNTDLKEGDEGDDVKAMQELLFSYGYFDETVTPYGEYGPVTVEAVQEFQLSYKLIADLNDPIAGVYESSTREKLEHLPAPFSDVSITHDFCRYIAYLSNRGIVEGYAGGTFKPEQNINRAEALKIILETFGISSSGDTTLPFKDVKTDDWFHPYVKTAYVRDIVDGYETNEGTLFKPGGNITRAEAVKIILETGNIGLENCAEQIFVDNTEADWFHKYVCTASNLGMLLPKSVETIEPNTPITRGELCRAIVKADLKQKYSL